MSAPRACQTGGTATLLYSDTTGAVSQIAFDPWGNYVLRRRCLHQLRPTSANDDKVTSSNLNELPYTAGTGFAATPSQLLQTLTDASPANYDNQLDGVAVTSTGTVYYADQNDGTVCHPQHQSRRSRHQRTSTSCRRWAQREWSSTPTATSGWWSTTPAAITSAKRCIGDLATPNAQYDGAPVTATATVVDNALAMHNGCGPRHCVLQSRSSPLRRPAPRAPRSRRPLSPRRSPALQLSRDSSPSRRPSPNTQTANLDRHPIPPTEAKEPQR
jgi:hypothetical protein